MRLSYRDTFPYRHQNHLGLDKIRQSDSSSVCKPLAGKTEASHLPPPKGLNGKEMAKKRKGERKNNATETEDCVVLLSHVVLSQCSLIINTMATFWLFGSHSLCVFVP